MNFKDVDAADRPTTLRRFALDDDALQHTTRSQQTLARPAQISGFGLWSGRDITVEFRPAEEDTGVIFVRHDLAEQPRIPAHVDYRVEAPRRTTLSHQGAQVEMVEHVLAALAGLQVDNCEVWVDSAEMPGVDGSSLPFVEALQAAGTIQQQATRSQLIVTDRLRVGDDECWIEASPARDGHCWFQYRLDYGHDHPIGRETVKSKITPQTFATQFAPARTFIMQHEAEWLRSQGLATRVTTQDVLVFGDEGLVENELRMENECAAHKLMDMIGDLSMGNCDLVGQFAAHRSGHQLNATLLKTMLSEFKIQSSLRATG